MEENYHLLRTLRNRYLFKEPIRNIKNVYGFLAPYSPHPVGSYDLPGFAPPFSSHPLNIFRSGWHILYPGATKLQCSKIRNQAKSDHVEPKRKLTNTNSDLYDTLTTHGLACSTVFNCFGDIGHALDLTFAHRPSSARSIEL